MADINSRFGSGNANLTPGGQGKPTLATVLREIAGDLAAGASESRFVEETLPVASDAGLLYYVPEAIMYVDEGGVGGAKTLRPQGETLAAGEAAQNDTEARQVDFAAADAVTSATVGYMKAQEQAAFDESLAETFALTDQWDLTVKVDGGAEQTALFETADFVDIANATAAEVAAVLSADIAGATAEDRGGKVVLRSDARGYDSSIEVTGGTAAAALGFSGTEQTGSGVQTRAV